ncbi:NTP transferase domain-containing protein [Natronorubrum sp. JWXQ-INN-674]|uniref:Probable molybdenum cofactor guanylyltransferase n=1 Tax=Natronorubrum halalkaliphilum TaxID=2691917 RepID=A0A6B0VNW9_9EURY|nr:molybdenum cofactor guanylyltransferase [Natronorubrum halalkaliphilum]MXV63178.1 NTP transferase domain-containing protein [Natronorubrum halalkaliphilum]
MTADDSFGGVVLAGGYSTRFGETDKAVAELAGTPMIRRVAERVATVADDLVINCRDEQSEAIRAALSESDCDPRYATDPVPDRGPLAGIQVGLEAVDREHAAVVACDMPFVDPTLLETLHERSRGHDGTVVRLADGWYQTTQAVYRTDAMTVACEDALASEDGRIVAALEQLDIVEMCADDLEDVSEWTFESIDTPDALLEAERWLAETEP